MNRKEYQKKYRELNKEEITEYKKVWYNENSAAILKKSAEYYQSNKEKIKEKNKKRKKLKENLDSNYKTKVNVATSIMTGIANQEFSDKLSRFLGYSFLDLKKYLEDLFAEDMTWKNFSVSQVKDGSWHIHNHIPTYIYNFYDESDIKKCWSLENLSPMWNKYANNTLNWEIINDMGLSELLPEIVLVEDIIGDIKK